MMRALRGATTLDTDTRDQLLERVGTLVTEMLARNDLAPDDLVSVIFTATADIHSEYPAAAARAVGLTEVALLCARELEIEGGMPRCIRVLMHVVTPRTPGELRHVYLEGAAGIRTDLPR